MNTFERVQTGVRIERRLLKVLKALAEHLEDVRHGLVVRGVDADRPSLADQLAEAIVARDAAFASIEGLLAEFDAAFRDVDAIVAPTTPVLAPLIGEEYVQIDDSRINVRPALVGMSRPANFTGLPAISVPCGFSSEGLPIGLQLIGRAFDETKLLRIAHSYEREHDWNERHPRL